MTGLWAVMIAGPAFSGLPASRGIRIIFDDQLNALCNILAAQPGNDIKPGVEPRRRADAVMMLPCKPVMDRDRAESW
ncbi:hypothetical protein [Neorhizobium petrolearium]|uniref:hypothetical protein n=1 Tax=Neorhizobium petrolearium TaxID=515361 RepID=UPI003F149A75